MYAIAVVDEDGLTGPLSFGNHDSQMGDNVVPDTDGDNNEATATGNLNIKWGADSFDGGIDGTSGFRSIPSSRISRAASAIAASHSPTTASPSPAWRTADVAWRCGDIQAQRGRDRAHGQRRVGRNRTSRLQVSLSDEGTGQFRVVLLDQLDHAPNGNENDIALNFNYTATDPDGDAVNGAFIVNVDDDIPTTASTRSSWSTRTIWQPAIMTRLPAMMRRRCRR